jgi:hypothetical protein
MNGVVATGVMTDGAVAMRAECIRADLEVVIVSTVIEAVAGVVAKVKPYLTIGMLHSKDHLEMSLDSGLSIRHAEA